MNSSLDRADNLANACRYIEEAAGRGADLVVLPEFFNTIFFAQYCDPAWHKLAEADKGPSITAIREAARRHQLAVIATIYEEVQAGLYFDTAIHIRRDGEIAFKYRKVHPARAFENGCFLAAANKVGKSGDCTLGGGLIVDATGTVLQSANTLTETMIMADIEGAEVQQARIQYPSRRDRRPDLYTLLTIDSTG